MRLDRYSAEQLRLIYRVTAHNNSAQLWGQVQTPTPARDGARMSERIERQKGVRFIRGILNVALDGAPEEVFDDPMRVFDRGGRSLALSIRIARAINNLGFELSSSSGSLVYQGGIRRRMELEDFIDGALVAAGASVVSTARHNDQARDRLSEAIYDSLRHSRVVLRRRAR